MARVNPKLEYCILLWNPAACHDNWSVISKLESIQRRLLVSLMTLEVCLVCKIPLLARRATIGYLVFKLLPYSKRMRKMNLITRGERRIRGDLIGTIKVVTGKVEYGKDI